MGLVGVNIDGCYVLGILNIIFSYFLVQFYRYYFYFSFVNEEVDVQGLIDIQGLF